jgi:hypothetical protein
VYKECGTAVAMQAIWYFLVELLICRMHELHDVGAQVPIGEFLKGEFTD